MKTLFKYLTIAASVAVMYGCQDDHQDINTNDLPNANDIDVVIDTQTLDSNRVIFTFNNSGYTPVWIFSPEEKTTEFSFVKQYLIAGDYSVEVKMYNKNGLSVGSKVYNFSFSETYANYDEIIGQITGGAEKAWRIAAENEGHLGCGENQSNPTGWWAAGSHEKDGTGVYDDRLIFNADGTYTYNPGEDGLVYCNKDVQTFGGAAADYDAATNEVKGTWRFEYRGADLYLILSENSILGYIAADAQLQKPEFVVKKHSASEMTLIWNGNGISWQYIIAFGEPSTFDGVNLWNNDDVEITKYYATTGNWEDITGKLTITKDGNTYSVDAPVENVDTWQTQVALHSNVGSTADKNYLFRVTLTANAAHENVTVKLTQDDDDGNYIFEKKGEYKLEPNKPQTIEIIAKGVDADKLKIVFDFGKQPANFKVDITDIILAEYEGELSEPEPEPEPELVVPTWEKFTANPSGDITATFEWKPAVYIGGDSWESLDEYKVTNNDSEFSLHIGRATGELWKGQFRIISQTELPANKKYDVTFKMKSCKTIKGATIKLESVDESVVLFEQGDVNIIEGIENVFVANGISSEQALTITEKDDNKGGFMILFGIGGNPADTDFLVYDIAIQESK